MVCLKACYKGNWTVLCCPLLAPLVILYYGLCCCLCLPSEKSKVEEELPGKNFNETVIDIEEPNYQFEDINRVRQDCRGPVGPSGTRGPPQAIPLPNLSLN